MESTKNTLISILSKSLVGKKIKHKNQHSREVVLEVEAVAVKHNHRQITEDTRENDWWGESCDWDTIKINFIDGSHIEVSLNSSLEFVS